MQRSRIPSVSDNALKEMLDMLDFQDNLINAIDAEIKECQGRIIDLAKQKDKECDAYLTMYTRFNKILNADYVRGIGMKWYHIYKNKDADAHYVGEEDFDNL